MLSQKNTCRRHENPSAESASPACELVFNEDMDASEPLSRGQRCEPRYAGGQEASKFIKGITIALPASITLWAGMIMGLKAIF